MVEVLEDLDSQPPVPQPEEGVTYAAKIDKAEARIDFTHDAGFIERQIRALNPVPGAFFENRGERFRVHAATIDNASGKHGELLDDSLLIACGSSANRPTLTKREGKAALNTGAHDRGRN